MRQLVLVLGIFAATPLAAESISTGFSDFAIGGLQGSAGSATALLETDWSLGAVGVQVGSSVTSFGADNSTAAFRAILTRDLRWPVRLGLSVAYESSDRVRDDTVTFGFHGLYRSDHTYFEANLLLPNHIRETGAFSFNIAGEQRISEKLSIKTSLYRLSTDLEDPDYYTISLTANYAANDSLAFFVEGFQTTSDNYEIKGNGTHLGMAYQFAPHANLRVSLDSLRPEQGDASLGASLALHYDFGGPRDQGRMFQTLIIPDRYHAGAFDPGA